jgi:hypothetical protein
MHKLIISNFITAIMEQDREQSEWEEGWLEFWHGFGPKTIIIE